MDDDPDPTPAEELWWANGMHPPWKRVWADGVDVTDQDPSTWPALWQPTPPPRSNRHGRKPKHTTTLTP